MWCIGTSSNTERKETKRKYNEANSERFAKKRRDARKTAAGKASVAESNFQQAAKAHCDKTDTEKILEKIQDASGMRGRGRKKKFIEPFLSEPILKALLRPDSVPRKEVPTSRDGKLKRRKREEQERKKKGALLQLSGLGFARGDLESLYKKLQKKRQRK